MGKIEFLEMFFSLYQSKIYWLDYEPFSVKDLVQWNSLDHYTQNGLAFVDKEKGVK